MSTRLQKYMADCGVASRRKCEGLIVSGNVTVNGVTITELGTKVEENDVVKVNGKAIKPVAKKIYIMMNKPVGYLTSVGDDRGRNTVMDLIDGEISSRVFPVGRLDYDTEGLLLMTNDGELANALMHPKKNIDKTYKVVIDKVPSPLDIEKLKRGVVIDGRKTYPAKVDWLKDNTLMISIHEGRNRQVRKMCESLGFAVKYLQRVSVGNLTLGNVPLGRWRHLSIHEVLQRVDFVIEIHRVPTFSNEIIMRMSEGTEVLSEAKAVANNDGSAEIISIDSYDMGKALLNAIDLMGIKKVLCYDNGMEKLLRALRFKLENDVYSLDLTGYFDSGC